MRMIQNEPLNKTDSDFDHIQNSEQGFLLLL